MKPHVVNGSISLAARRLAGPLALAAAAVLILGGRAAHAAPASVDLKKTDIYYADPAHPNISGLWRPAPGQRVVFAGVMSVLQRPPTAKGVAFLTLEDETGTVDVVLRKEVFEAHERIIREDRFLVVEGRVQRNGTGASVLGSGFRRFGESRTKNPNVAGKHPRSLKAGEWG